MAFVFSVSTFANQDLILRGEVTYSSQLSCKVTNPVDQDLTITDYAYRVLWVNQYGSRVWTTVDYHCGFNCDLSVDEVKYLIGPQNRRNFVGAHCWAYADVLDDGDDDQDDDVVSEVLN